MRRISAICDWSILFANLSTRGLAPCASAMPRHVDGLRVVGDHALHELDVRLGVDRALGDGHRHRTCRPSIAGRPACRPPCPRCTRNTAATARSAANLLDVNMGTVVWDQRDRIRAGTAVRHGFHSPANFGMSNPEPAPPPRRPPSPLARRDPGARRRVFRRRVGDDRRARRRALSRRTVCDVAVAVYCTLPLVAFLRWRGWPFYPSAAFRLLVVRPVLYANLLLPLVAGAGADRPHRLAHCSGTLSSSGAGSRSSMLRSRGDRARRRLRRLALARRSPRRRVRAGPAAELRRAAHRAAVRPSRRPAHVASLSRSRRPRDARARARSHRHHRRPRRRSRRGRRRLRRECSARSTRRSASS